MKRLLEVFGVWLVLFGFLQCQPSHPSQWSEKKLNKWFEAGEYLNGLQLKPGRSTDLRTFAIHYHDYKTRWDKAFDFLKHGDLAGLPVGDTQIGDGVYVTVSIGSPKEREAVQFEAHKKRIDVFCVVSGREVLDVASSETMTVMRPYDERRDVAFGTVPEFTEHICIPNDQFFMCFPADAHRPGMGIDSNSAPIRRIVVKIPIE